MLLQWFTVEIFKIDCLVKMLVQKKMCEGRLAEDITIQRERLHQSQGE